MLNNEIIHAIFLKAIILNEPQAPWNYQYIQIKEDTCALHFTTRSSAVRILMRC